MQARNRVPVLPLNFVGHNGALANADVDVCPGIILVQRAMRSLFEFGRAAEVLYHTLEVNIPRATHLLVAPLVLLALALVLVGRAPALLSIPPQLLDFFHRGLWLAAAVHGCKESNGAVSQFQKFFINVWGNYIELYQVYTYKIDSILIPLSDSQKVIINSEICSRLWTPEGLLRWS